MRVGARTFIGGITDLSIGSSEEVCKAFWQKILSPSILRPTTFWQKSLSPSILRPAIRMDVALQQAQKEKYDTTAALGIVGDGRAFWRAPLVLRSVLSQLPILGQALRSRRDMPE